jgi:hypothetical protein
MHFDHDIAVTSIQVIITLHRRLNIAIEPAFRHNRDLQDTPSIRVSVVGMKMASINRNWLGFSTMYFHPHNANPN